MDARHGSSRTIFHILFLIMSFSLTPQFVRADWMASAIPNAEESKYGTLFGARFSRTEYDVGSAHTDVTRYSIGGAVSAAAMEDLDVYVGAAYIARTSPTAWSNNGAGFVLAGGAKAGDWPLGPVHLSTYGQLRYTDESFGRSRASNYTADANTVEFVLGGTVRYPFHEAMDLYADLSVCPYTSGELTSSAEGSTYKMGWERNRKLGAALGAVVDLQSWKLHTQIDVLAEVAFFIGASLTL